MQVIEHTEELASPPSAGERRALIDRVSRSAQFVRSARLREFLKCVGYASLGPHAEDINEHEIGVRVFGRPPDYDRSQDNIVRVNATELRKRVEKYFETEGLHEPLVFSIPRGSYLPRFEWRAVEISPTALPSTFLHAEISPADAKSDPSEHPASNPEAPAQRTNLLLVAGTLVLAGVCIVLAWQNWSLRRHTDVRVQRPEVSDFWGTFANSAPQTDIVLPDASFIMSDEILGKPISLGDYTRKAFPGSSNGNGMSAERREDLDAVFAHNLVMLGDFNAAQHILALGTIAPSIRISFARFYEADSIRRSNVILIGGRKANPWAQLFDDQLNFALEHGGGHSPTFITNRHPAAGEQNQYFPLSDPSHMAALSVIACIPNFGKTGKVILIEGTDSDATSAAAEFLTSEEGLRTLREKLGEDHLGDFEALLKTPRLNGAPFGAEVVAVRKR